MLVTAMHLINGASGDSIIFGVFFAASSSFLNAAELSGSISFVNDYRWRGVSQTAGDPAIQGSLDLNFDNGVYVGLWGSNIDFDDANADLELDWYIGYSSEISNGFSYDATLYYYQYPGIDDINYHQLAFNLYHGNFSATYQYTNDFAQTSAEGHYLAMGYSHPITDDMTLDLHAGYSYGDYWEDFDVGNYIDYSLGVSTQIQGVDFSVAYIGTDLNNTYSSGAFRNDKTVVLTLGKSF